MGDGSRCRLRMEQQRHLPLDRLVLLVLVLRGWVFGLHEAQGGQVLVPLGEGHQGEGKGEELMNHRLETIFMPSLMS
jgi:hypothetical protein